MTQAPIHFSDTKDIEVEDVIALYESNEWSSAKKPQKLMAALMGSHSLVTAWDGKKLVGLGNAITDGHLVVYYPHLLVMPSYQRRGIGRELVRRLMTRYDGFHQQMLVADGRTIEFYKKCGFERAGRSEPLWIYAGTEH
jgi:ribosomal protein S18 acetylase RimI-like enzyme